MFIAGLWCIYIPSEGDMLQQIITQQRLMETDQVSHETWLGTNLFIQLFQNNMNAARMPYRS